MQPLALAMILSVARVSGSTGPVTRVGDVPGPQVRRRGVGQGRPVAARLEALLAFVSEGDIVSGAQGLAPATGPGGDTQSDMPLGQYLRPVVLSR